MKMKVVNWLMLIAVVISVSVLTHILLIIELTYVFDSYDRFEDRITLLERYAGA